MQMSGNTILVTGGSSGIGHALAKRFLDLGNTVIICGRREDKLREAQSRNPGFHIEVCDTSRESDRIALVQRVTKQFPDLNILLNNAGMQQQVNLLTTTMEWNRFQLEIDTNFAAPVHLCLLLGKVLASQANPAIINVSSGLAFTPAARTPVYCATKAAVHSFTISLRAQLASAGVDVVEVAPPAVNTDLGGADGHTYGVPLDEFADAVMADLAAGKPEIGYGSSSQALRMSRDEIDATTAMINKTLPIPS
ncbi:MAG: SDR family NAD(P)-dependent oxidoreductase [Planctomycetaceae bacterium]|nr:SDR family NAD(P)-dependent oxidoreductase [Planctomycetaceae bacterium]